MNSLKFAVMCLFIGKAPLYLNSFVRYPYSLVPWSSHRPVVDRQIASVLVSQASRIFLYFLAPPTGNKEKYGWLARLPRYQAF